MKILKNQKGVSLVEALIGISLTAAAGVAYMTHTQNVAKNEARQKVRASIEVLNSQALDYLKSRDVCNENISKAFASIPLVGSDVNGDADYKALKNKGFKDAAGVVQSKSIFSVGDVFDGGRILVSDVSYKVSELVDINQPSSPWTKSGKIKVSIEMETCKDSGPVVLKNASGVMVDRCAVNMRNKTTKSYDKYVAFRTNGSSIIVDTPIREKKVNPVTGAFEWTVVGTKKDLACADSQDALVEAAAQYTDLKVCLSQLKTMMLAEKNGSFEFDCGLKLTQIYVEGRYTENFNFQVPANVNIKIHNLEAQAGGGSGGKGGKGGLNWSRGGGGQAGGRIAETNYVMTSASPLTCNIVAGKGGQAVHDHGSQGSNSGIDCGPALKRVANGGNGGGYRVGGGNCGVKGGDSHYGQGSSGHCRTSRNDTVAAPGAGGAGGGEKNNTDSKAGGDGFVAIKLSGVAIEDQNNVLPILGITVQELLP